MGNESPVWAQRIRALREARGLSQSDAAEEMRTHSKKILPAADHLLRRWKAWEPGENKPGRDYAPLIAATLGTVTAALFPPVDRTNSGLTVLSATGMDTLEIVSRLQSSDVNDATLEGLRITVEKLCSEYAYMPPADLIIEGRQWLRRIVDMQEQRLGFRQRRDTLELAGWLALLVGCLEYDLGDRRAAEGTRKMALSLGQEIENSGILGWAHEMRAWFAITSGDYPGGPSLPRRADSSRRAITASGSNSSRRKRRHGLGWVAHARWKPPLNEGGSPSKTCPIQTTRIITSSSTQRSTTSTRWTATGMSGKTDLREPLRTR
jgi:transcriptional regulator with XRE-family HTH domain